MNPARGPIGSRHPSVQQLRRLSGRRAARLAEEAFVVEGPMLLEAALDAGVEIREVFVAPGVDAELLVRAERAGAVVHEVAARVLERSLDTVTSQGVAAIAVRDDVGVEAAVAAAATGPLALVLVDVGDPGNAGTLVRAAGAAGAAAVLFCGESVDPWNPKCVRASAGTLFHIPVSSGGDPVSVVQLLGAAGVQSVGTVVRDGTPYDTADLRGPLALVLGNEARGLPASILDQMDLRLTIPMAGRAESLNVAMAGSVLCFESLRQRRAGA